MPIYNDLPARLAKASAEKAADKALTEKIDEVIKREPTGIVTPERFAELAAELGLNEGSE